MDVKKRIMRIRPLIALSATAISVLVITITSVSMLTKFNRVVQEQAIENLKINMHQLKLSTEITMEDMIKDCGYVEDALISNKGNITTDVDNQINAMYTSSKNIVSIALFSAQGRQVKVWPSYQIRQGLNIKDTTWFTNTLNDRALYYFVAPGVDGIYEEHYTRTVAVCTKITIENGNATQDMIVRLDMDYSHVGDLFNEATIGERGYLYITDDNNNILYHPEQQVLFGGGEENTLALLPKIEEDGHIIDEELNKVVSLTPLNYSDWKIIGVAFSDDIQAVNSEVIQYILWVLLLGICITILSSIYIASRISDPVTQLEKSMRRVMGGDFFTRINITSGESEVVALTKSFNHMVSRIQELIKENQKEHEAMRKAELDALQSQINPHFLYNTLDSIVWMAETDNKQEVITMVNALANFFRISISGGRGVIALEDELKHAQSYMLIQKCRYSDRFEYETDVKEELLGLLVPKLMIQPLLENAIYHGIEYLMDRGYIKVTAEADDDKLYIKIIDNGVGMSDEALANILKEKRNKRNGVGVKNVNERIQLIFGEEYGVSYASEMDVGTTVTITLPRINYEVDMDAK